MLAENCLGVASFPLLLCYRPGVRDGKRGYFLGGWWENVLGSGPDLEYLHILH